MKYYLIDDEIGIVKTLENLIESRNLGEVIGYATDPVDAAEEIIELKPDIVLADLLMSRMDGIALVQNVKRKRPEISFVMLSKVADKSMIEQAYHAGVEFFVNKPVNVIEIEKVLQNVADKIKMNSIVSNIRGMFAGEELSQNSVVRESRDSVSQSFEKTSRELRLFLGLLGMLGEKGTADIIDVCRYLDNKECGYQKEILIQVAEEKGETPKNLEQRIRRAIKKGLYNVAVLGIEDYGSEVFQIYANYVFDFKNIKEEMEYIRGQREAGGRVNISKFIEGLIVYRNTLE